MKVKGQCQVKDNQVLRFGSVEARLDLGLQQWEDTACEETAVFAMQRIMRDQRREKKNPKPEDPSMTLEAESGAEMGDHTVLLTRPAAQPEAKPSLSFPPPQAEPRQGSRGIIVAVLIVLGLAAVVWWLVWGRK